MMQRAHTTPNITPSMTPNRTPTGTPGIESDRARRPIGGPARRLARGLVATLGWALLTASGSAWGQEGSAPPPPPPPRHGGPPGAPHGDLPDGPPHHRRGPPPIERVLERNAERLGLDPSVEAEIRTLSEASRAGDARIRESLDAAHERMRTLLSADAPDESEVLEQADRIGLLETEAQKNRLSAMLRIRALLTPEQRALLVEIHEERRSRRGDRPHRPNRDDPSRGDEIDGSE